MTTYTHVDRIAGLPRQSFFLLGCRGTGKSTWLRSQLPHARWIDLLDEARYQRYLADPSLFAADLRGCVSRNASCPSGTGPIRALCAR